MRSGEAGVSTWSEPEPNELALRLVLGVARLGESDLRDWWRSKALSAVGEYVLGGMFPRTWVLTALELDVLSAKARHEEALRRQTALHIFSDQLPFQALAISWLREHKLLRDPNGIATSLREWTIDTARQDLTEWVGGPAPTGEPLAEGLRLGSVSAAELRDPATLDRIVRSLAASYIDQIQVLRFPYYDLLQ
jgi:hypothetical protein